MIHAPAPPVTPLVSIDLPHRRLQSVDGALTMPAMLDRLLDEACPIGHVALVVDVSDYELERDAVRRHEVKEGEY